MTPYNVQLVKELKPIDHPMRFRFAKWACDQLTEDADFGKKKIIFSDEAHFDLGGYVNKPNCHIWDTGNTHAHTLKSLHTQNESLFSADFSPKA